VNVVNVVNIIREKNILLAKHKKITSTFIQRSSLAHPTANHPPTGTAGSAGISPARPAVPGRI